MSGLKRWNTSDIDFAVFINVSKEKGSCGEIYDDNDRLVVMFNNFDDVDQARLDQWRAEYENSRWFIADMRRKKYISRMMHIKNRNK